VKKSELLKNEIVEIEFNIDEIKKDLEIIKYLANCIEGIATNIGWGLDEMKSSLDNIKALSGSESEKK
jgi:hypothetical protein